MLEFQVPPDQPFTIEHVVLDYNGTCAVDGELLPGVKELFADLCRRVNLHVLTADTFGGVQKNLGDVNAAVYILPTIGAQDRLKLEYVKKLGADKTVCIGNGRNDVMMIQEARIGIAVVQAEGSCARTLSAADIVCISIIDALNLLLHPKRLSATLRNG